MPTVNLTARKLRVRIGADLQDWSAAVSAFTAEESGLSEDGLKQVEGQLFIEPIPNPPESIDPYENPSRWRPGTPVLIEVTGDGGGWIVPRYGRLFILEEPDFPQPGQGIAVQVGCRLTWHNTYEFDDDATGVVVGTPTNSATVAQRLLEANEIASGDISLGTWPYNLSIPEGKGPTGSFIQQAGELAYANDWRYLYQNVAGTIVSAALNLGIGSPLITITLGSNDVLYQPAKVDTAGPPDVLRVAAMEMSTTTLPNPSVTVEEVYSEEDPPVLLRRTTISISWDSSNKYIRTLNETNFRFVESGSKIVPTEEILEHLEYNASSALIKKTTTQRKTIVTPTFPTFRYQWYDNEVLTEIYNIGSNDVLQSIVSEKQVATVVVGTTIEATLSKVEDVTLSWQQLSASEWKMVRTTIQYPRFVGAENLGVKPVDPQTVINISNTGETQPPKVEFFDNGISTQETEFAVELTYTIPGGGSGRTRKRLYTLPYGFSQAQCENIANLHLGLIAGRHRAALIEFAVSDALLTAAPLFPCDVVMPSGEIRHYRVDGLAWEHTANQAKVAGVGILIGTTPAPTEVEPNPTPVPITGKLVVDDTVSVVDSDALIYEVV